MRLSEDCQTAIVASTPNKALTFKVSEKVKDDFLACLEYQDIHRNDFIDWIEGQITLYVDGIVRGIEDQQI